MLEDYFEEEEEEQQQQPASAAVVITNTGQQTRLHCRLFSSRGQRKGTVCQM